MICNAQVAPAWPGRKRGPMFSVIIAAFLGALLLGLLGWCKSSEPFSPRKFLATAITALVAAAGMGLSYADQIVTAKEIVLAFLTGAGIDYVRHALQGTVQTALRR